MQWYSYCNLNGITLKLHGGRQIRITFCEVVTVAITSLTSQSQILKCICPCTRSPTLRLIAYIYTAPTSPLLHPSTKDRLDQVDCNVLNRKEVMPTHQDAKFLVVWVRLFHLYIALGSTVPR